MGKNQTEILAAVADYYSAKLAKHGATPRGVDWNGKESQMLRFEQLTKIIRQMQGFSLNDLGCGYGALLDYLHDRYKNFVYNGCDVSAEMINAAQFRYTAFSKVNFFVAAVPPEKADYGIASGIFNVRLGYNDSEWLNYFETTLDALDQTSQLGFAFNCLTTYSDRGRKHDYLYYADPYYLFNLCKNKYSRNVALLHDYGLYEFTILVRKEI